MGYVTTLPMAIPDAEISALRFLTACGGWTIHPTAKVSEQLWIGSAVIGAQQGVQLSAITLTIGATMHSVTDGRTAPYLVSMISPVSAVSTRRHLRSAGQGDLVVPRTRTAGFGPQSFSVAGPLAWNSLPLEMKTTSLTLRQFSNRLKTEMFYVVTTRQGSRHNYYYKTAWNINTVTELNWTAQRNGRTATTERQRQNGNGLLETRHKY